MTDPIDITERFGNLKDGHIPDVKDDGSLDLVYVINTMANLDAYNSTIAIPPPGSSVNSKINYVIRGYRLLYKLGILLADESNPDISEIVEKIETYMGVDHYLTPKPVDHPDYRGKGDIEKDYGLIRTNVLDALRENNRDKLYSFFAYYIGLNAVGLRDSMLQEMDALNRKFSQGIFEFHFPNFLLQHKSEALEYGRLQTTELSDVKIKSPGFPLLE